MRPLLRIIHLSTLSPNPYTKIHYQTMRLSTTKYVRTCTLSNSTSQNAMPSRTKRKKNLNMKIQYSPKNLDRYLNNSSSLAPSTATKVSEKWMDYQGIKNWEGLLDPLDENLRGEIIRYGHFVESAYISCNIDTTSSLYATCRYTKRKLLNESGFTGTGYQVTKNLTANSGLQLPKWLERAPSWMAMQSSWIGYVAVCQDKKEIARLGRRDVVIALRGTVTCLEWLENLRATLTPLPYPDSDSDSDSHSGPMVESGFLSLYTSNLRNRPSLQTILREEISRILEKYGAEQLSFTITGHSLGAALAILAAYDIKETFKNSPLVTVISFAGPRVGNWSLRCSLEKQGTKVLRIVNSDDLITKVPGFVVENNERNYTAANWVQKLVYADVGCELRLSSRESPYLNGINIATCHDLETYLHLVKGFVSSNCPFRKTARKMIMNNNTTCSFVKI